MFDINDVRNFSREEEFKLAQFII